MFPLSQSPRTRLSRSLEQVRRARVLTVPILPRADIFFSNARHVDHRSFHCFCISLNQNRKIHSNNSMTCNESRRGAGIVGKGAGQWRPSK